MVKVESVKNQNASMPSELLKNKRHLTEKEIQILKENQNHNDDETWNNIYVEKDSDFFDASLIRLNFFTGFVIIGKLRNVKLHYNDLVLTCGIYRSHLGDVVIGDDCVIRNVGYFENYRIANRVILSDISEISCTKHSKFGNGILKEGEPEENRIWIGVANENDGRAILPFESMIPADAYLWSHYRSDRELLERFISLTENKNDRKLNTFGIIGEDCVIKNCSIIKDAKIGSAAYIKGAFKLKNITILSSEEEPSQIGEGVEMVNGILGYGSKVFYQAIAIRFVIGRNCQVKYGARLLNSVLGDNSTISCCEVLNNLIFPFHEQHHNSSFLIATTIMGQSNIAAGATIGSNHNSRSPDGEIFAKRGFWPGLCSDFKHNSRFASFVLVAKGSYQYELDIPYPFALVSPGNNGDMSVNIIPAWWFMYDMFAITRNKNKFLKRDKRVVKIQKIETDPLAPDTMQEIMSALERIIGLTAIYLQKTNNECLKGVLRKEQVFQKAKDFLHQNPNADFTLQDSICQKKYGATVFKPVQAYVTYRKVVKYFAARTLMEFVMKQKNHSGENEFSAGENENEKICLTHEYIDEIRKIPLFTEWENIGGQIIPSQKVSELFLKIKECSVNDWQEVHAFYDECESQYENYKTRYALYLLEMLYSRPIEDFTLEVFANIKDDVIVVANEIYNASVQSREKDYTDYYRNMVYSSQKEMENVIGALDDNSFLIELKNSTFQFISQISDFF